MRIAYISLHWPRTRNSGVGKKIQSQIDAWRSLGHEARLFMHTTPYEPQSELIEADYFFYTASGGIRTELDRIHAMQRMITAVSAFQPDVIYLRYSIYVFPAHQLMKIAPVVEEINTNDLTQHEELGSLYSLYNWVTRGILFRRVHGLIAVSHELADCSAFVRYHKPTCVIANGVNLDSFEQLPAPSNKIPHIAFIGSPGYSWHGVDKLVSLAKLVPDVHLDIIGYRKLPGFDSLPVNMTLHGYLPQDEYQRILASADAAFSSLALHRVQLEEASPLKSRECLAFGLPLIVAYKDTDLHDLECNFLLKIPNKEDNIQTHAAMIREFAYKMRGVRAARDQILRLDDANKEARRIAFFLEVLGSRRVQG
ncbi:MAG: glycosyltransferase family 4 protein [Anaerolineales bacterium]